MIIVLTTVGVYTTTHGVYEMQLGFAGERLLAVSIALVLSGLS